MQRMKIFSSCVIEVWIAFVALAKQLRRLFLYYSEDQRTAPLIPTMAAADEPQTTKLMVARGDEVERDGAVYKVCVQTLAW